MRMEKILSVVLNEAYKEQVEATMDALPEGPESFLKSYLDR